MNNNDGPTFIRSPDDEKYYKKLEEAKQKQAVKEERQRAKQAQRAKEEGEAEARRIAWIAHEEQERLHIQRWERERAIAEEKKNARPVATRADVLKIIQERPGTFLGFTFPQWITLLAIQFVMVPMIFRIMNAWYADARIEEIYTVLRHVFSR